MIDKIVERLDDNESARRVFLRLMGGTLGASCLALNWTEVACAANHAAMAHAAAAPGAPGAPAFLTAAEAADVEAVAAQIIPTDATPGAREAGVVVFIDQALTGFYSRQAAVFRSGLLGFQTRVHEWRPEADSFAALPSDQQIKFLHTVEHTPFFDSMRFLTVLGMFAMPVYGGNRDGAGWKLLGFEDRHAFEPPFGYYDRDYPGFTAEAAKSK